MSEYRNHVSRTVLLSPHYTKHVSAMTGEDLYSKGEIAEELAARDIEIEILREEVQRLSAVISEPVAWQRRRRYEINSEWEQCSKREACDPFDRSPYHEYRTLCLATPSADAKDAALKLAHDALCSCQPGDYSTGHVIAPIFDEKLVSDAIAAIDAAMQKGGA